MSKFAERTSVSSDRSRQEIEKILVRYGADGFCYGWESNKAVIMFVLSGRHIRFLLPLPDKASKEFTTDGRGSLRGPEAVEKVYEQSVRQKWRALSLAAKAKLESVSSGITSFEDEFLAHIVLPNGNTVGNWLKPQIENAYKKGKMPPLLLTGATQ